MKHWIFTLFFILSIFGLQKAGFAEELRSHAQVRAFQRANACPGGPDKGSHSRCRGYVVDHIRPLDCGGLDDPSNMQYQTVKDGHAKDKWERNGVSCHHRTHAKLPPGKTLDY